MRQRQRGRYIYFKQKRYRGTVRKRQGKGPTKGQIGNRGTDTETGRHRDRKGTGGQVQRDRDREEGIQTDRKEIKGQKQRDRGRE